VSTRLTSLKIKWWFFRADLDHKRGRHERALINLEKIIGSDPRRALAFVRAGYCLNHLNRSVEALPFYERALQLVPTYADAHANLSFAYYDLGRYQEALDSLNRAMRNNPKLQSIPYWTYILAQICGKLQLWEQALAAFMKTAELNESDGNAWHGVGWAFSKLGRDSEAASALERAVRAEPMAQMLTGSSGMSTIRCPGLAKQLNNFANMRGSNRMIPPGTMVLPRHTVNLRNLFQLLSAIRTL